jgi:hypothetical protein
VAILTPQTYPAGTGIVTVLGGTADDIAAAASKFTVTPQVLGPDTQDWTVSPTGNLQKDYLHTTKSVTTWAALKTLIETTIPTGEKWAITLDTGGAELSANSTISVADKSVRLIAPSGGPVTAKRDANFSPEFFTISSNGALLLEGVILDGGAVWTDSGSSSNVTFSTPLAGRADNSSGITATASLILVSAGGTLTIGAGAVVQNNAIVYIENGYTAFGGGIEVDGGTLYLSGGTITNNLGGNYYTGSGAVNLMNNAQCTMSGGSITYNATNSQFDGQCGGVWVTSGCTFTMTGGSIDHNSGGQVGGVQVQGTFTMTSPAQIHDNYGWNSDNQVQGNFTFNGNGRGATNDPVGP